MKSKFIFHIHPTWRNSLCLLNPLGMNTTYIGAFQIRINHCHKRYGSVHLSKASLSRPVSEILFNRRIEVKKAY